MIVCFSHAKVGHCQAIYLKLKAQLNAGLLVYAKPHCVNSEAFLLMCVGVISKNAFQFTVFIDIIGRWFGAVCPFFVSASYVEINVKD